jgi:hypothetical protein
MQSTMDRHRSALRAAVSYLGAAGSVCFVINMLFNVRWRELIRLVITPTGQAVGVALGALILVVMALRRETDR